MFAFVQVSSPSFRRCDFCDEQIRTDEKCWQLQKNGKAVRGETYCVSCKQYGLENNEDNLHSHSMEDDGESHLRRMEDYAAYQANGCTSAYWEDQQ